LANVISAEIRRFFDNLEVVWTAAEVFSEIAEWGEPLSESISEVLREILANGFVQESYQFYLAGSIGIGAITAVALLAIAVAEEAPVDSTPQGSKILETMLFLLNSEVSSRTFNFWVLFAETNFDSYVEAAAVPWLQRVLSITLEKACWKDDLDHEEWSAYRTDVVEVFEAMTCILKPKILNASVTSYLNITNNGYDIQEKIVVSSQFLVTIFILDVGDDLVLFNLRQEHIHARGNRPDKCISFDL
jgi:hypothetical protein